MAFPFTQLDKCLYTIPPKVSIWNQKVFAESVRRFKNGHQEDTTKDKSKNSPHRLHKSCVNELKAKTVQKRPPRVET